MKKLEEFIKKGVTESMAIVLAWGNLSQKEKRELSLNQLKSSWECAPSDIPEKTEIWKLIKSKAKTETFEQLKSLWEELPNSEKTEIRKLMKSKAETIKEYFWLWEELPNYDRNLTNLEKTEIWKLIKTKAKTETFEQLKSIWEKLPNYDRKLPNSEKTEIWKLMKSKAETIEQYFWLWKKTSGSEKTEIWGLIKYKDAPIEQYFWLWRNLYYNDSEREEISRLIGRKLKTFKECQLFFYAAQKRNFDPDNNFPEIYESWKLAYNKANTFKDYMWAFDNIPSYAYRDMINDHSWYVVHRTNLSSRFVDEVWDSVKSKVQSFEEAKSLLLSVNYIISYQSDLCYEHRKFSHSLVEYWKNSIWSQILLEAKTFEEFKWIWDFYKNCSDYYFDKSQEPRICKAAIEKMENPRSWEWFLEKIKDDSEKTKIWELIRSKVESFEHLKWVWENDERNSSIANQILDLVKLILPQKQKS